MTFMFKRVLYLFILLTLCAGCQRLMTLKNLASSQKQMEKYVASQQKGFLRLLEDIQHNRLKEGLSMRAVIRRYGEPIFCDPAESGTPNYPIGSGAFSPVVSQRCVFRGPTEYFSGQKVYMYFDAENILRSWIYEPAAQSVP